MQQVRRSNIRVRARTPSTVATELATTKLTDGSPDKVMQPEALAEFVVAQLKLNRRIFIKEAGMWSTNPQGYKQPKSTSCSGRLCMTC